MRDFSLDETEKCRVSKSYLTRLLFSVFVIGLSGQPTYATTTVVAMEGQQALGQSAGVKYWKFGYGDFSPDGVVSFPSSVGINSTGPLTSVGYVGQPSNLNIFATQGDALPSAGANDTITAPLFTSLAIGGQGTGADTFFGANSGPYSQTLVTGGPGAFTSIASPGQTAPIGGTYSGLFYGPIISADSYIAFYSDLSNTAGGMFLYSNGRTVPVALTGDTAPGSSAAFYHFVFPPSISDGGKVTFAAVTGGNGMTGFTGIWSGYAGSLQRIAATAASAPGTPTTFQSFTSSVPSVNRAGQLAFRANLGIGGSVTNSNDSGLWTNFSGSLSLIAREGDQAPGMAPGTLFGDFSSTQSTLDPSLNNQAIAFPTTLTGSFVGGAIFVGVPGSFKPVVIAGQPVNGLPSSVTTLGFYQIDMNALGQIVFYANLTGPGINSYTNKAILSYDPTLGVNLVAWAGAPIPGTNYTPYNGVVFDGGNGVTHANILSDTGLVVFTAFGGSGDAVMVESIPEPGSIVLWVVGGAFAALSRRRRSNWRSLNQ